MSDSLRQSTSDKVASNLKPESQKSTFESLSDSAKSTADQVAGSVQPSSEKSTTQKASDAVSGNNSSHTQAQGESYLQQASDAIGNAAQQASHALGLDQKK
ncbi:hypothetical protein AMS68_006711 [Peltaster fructicola]|uniref:Uncharacterized protein n=1 Tax=Peltaster fructicola TaxID=286661 RepID=A0A6H0Y2F3_9PEZI|nr:hypothetical protein AMS68_006711 [Peltaster fructicola]